jgi:hypothetical protein
LKFLSLPTTGLLLVDGSAWRVRFRRFAFDYQFVSTLRFKRGFGEVPSSEFSSESSFKTFVPRAVLSVCSWYVLFAT